MKLLNDMENEAALKFAAKHRCLPKSEAPRVAIITVTPTGIGDCVEIECGACGKKKDITDYENW